MDSLELLVHISAPGTVRYDKGTLALAEAIADFQSVKVTNVMDQEPKYLQEPSKSQSMPFSSALVVNNSSKRRVYTPEGSTQVKGNREVKRARVEASGFPNPPYRNPWHGRRDQSQVLQTPTHAQRPRTAPEGDSRGTVQVPRTNTERRRAYSDLSQCGISRIINSQDVDRVDESSESRISSPLRSKPFMTRLSQTPLEDQYSTDWTASSPGADTALPQKMTRSPTHSSTTATATATPSQPVEGLDGQQPSSSQAVCVKSPSIVTLSSGSSQQQSILSSKVMVRKQSGVQQSTPNATLSKVEPRLFPRLDVLSEKVVAPQPLTGSMRSTSHVSKHLQELIEALPLAKIFRPVQMSRAIKNLERGHWLLRVTVAPDATVHQARTSPSKEKKIQRYTDRFSATTARERLTQFWAAKAAGKLREFDYGDEDAAVGVWTEKEFVDFWNNLSAFIRDGKAGWAIRMVRDEVEVGHLGNESRQMRVRIFTWGEIMRHIYLAIWVCSDKVSARIAMEWVAGDGTVVVAMSGKRKYGGRINLASQGPVGTPGGGGSSGPG